MSTHTHNSLCLDLWLLFCCRLLLFVCLLSPLTMHISTSVLTFTHHVHNFQPASISTFCPRLQPISLFFPCPSITLLFCKALCYSCAHHIQSSCPRLCTHSSLHHILFVLLSASFQGYNQWPEVFVCFFSFPLSFLFL